MRVRLVFSRLQNAMKLCEMSRTVSDMAFQVIGPDTAKLHGPYRISSVIKSQWPMAGA